MRIDLVGVDFVRIDLVAPNPDGLTFVNCKILCLWTREALLPVEEAHKSRIQHIECNRLRNDELSHIKGHTPNDKSRSTHALTPTFVKFENLMPQWRVVSNHTTSLKMKCWRIKQVANL